MSCRNREMPGSVTKFPSYSELGKDCRNLFSKGYPFGLFSINVRNITCHGVEIVTKGVHKNEDKSAVGEVQINSTYPLDGLASNHKWDTENNLVNELSFQDFFPGAKVAVEGRFNGDSMNKGGSFKVQHKHPRFTFDALVNGADDSNAVVGGSLVTGLGGLMAAYKLDYDTNEGSLKANNVAVAYQSKEYSLVAGYENLSVVNGTYFHKIGRDMEVGCMCKVGGGGEGEGEAAGGTQFAIAGKFVFSGYGHTIRAKVDNKSVLGLGLELKIVPGFNASAAGEIDLKNFSAGNHKIGFGLDFGI